MSEMCKEDKTQVPHVPNPNADWHLQSLVDMVNKHTVTFGITLMVGGEFITGTLIGGTSYFNYFADSFADNWPVDNKEEIRASFKARGDMFTEDVPIDNLRFIHLANAQVVRNGNFQPIPGCLWRGKISSVDGFILGSMSPAKS